MLWTSTEQDNLFLLVSWAFSAPTAPSQIASLHSPPWLCYKLVTLDNGFESHRKSQLTCSVQDSFAAVWHLPRAVLHGPEEGAAGPAATILLSMLWSKSWQPQGSGLGERQVSVTIKNNKAFCVVKLARSTLSCWTVAAQDSWVMLCCFQKLSLWVMEAHTQTQNLPHLQNVLDPTRKKKK